VGTVNPDWAGTGFGFGMLGGRAFYGVDLTGATAWLSANFLAVATVVFAIAAAIATISLADAARRTMRENAKEEKERIKVAAEVERVRVRREFIARQLDTFHYPLILLFHKGSRPYAVGDPSPSLATPGHQRVEAQIPGAAIVLSAWRVHSAYRSREKPWEPPTETAARP
jgi:hypothetical protein